MYISLSLDTPVKQATGPIEERSISPSAAAKDPKHDLIFRSRAATTPNTSTRTSGYQRSCIRRDGCASSCLELRNRIQPDPTDRLFSKARINARR